MNSNSQASFVDINDNQRNRWPNFNPDSSTKDFDSVVNSTAMLSNINGANGIRRHWDSETDTLLLELSERYNKSWRRIGHFSFFMDIF